MSQLTHVDENGQIRMVDVSAKEITRRVARAGGRIDMKPETVRQIRLGTTPKGNPLEAARLAGILGAKRTSELVPLCHPLLLEHVDVTVVLDDGGASIESSIVVTGKTGAEMEALTAVSVAALTMYDMCKAIDKEMVISGIRLLAKSGGKSGDYVRKA